MVRTCSRCFMMVRARWAEGNRSGAVWRRFV